MKIQIRQFQPTDLDQVLQLYFDTIHAINVRDYSQEQVNAWAPVQPDRERWLTKLTNNKAYVAEVYGTIVGFGDLTENGYLDHLYVHKDYQGKGIGSVLIKELEEKAQNLGLNEIHTESSITAKPFFERHGYTVIKRQDKQYKGLIFINYSMKKKIN